MAKPGDVVEFRSGTFGIQAPLNLAILLDRRRVKGVVHVELWTTAGRKDCNAERLTRRAFRSRYEGRIEDEAELAARLRHFLGQHAQGGLAEDVEDDLAKLEQELWERTCDDPRPSWTEPDLADAYAGGPASAAQLRQVREALARCRRPGTGRFQTAGRGDLWRPWSRTEADAMRRAWQDLEAVRRKLVATREVDGERTYARVGLAEAGLDARDAATLAWVAQAMQQYVEHDGVPREPTPVAGIGGLPAVQAFGMDLHRALGFLAMDWIRGEPTTHSSDYVQFLLEAGLRTSHEVVEILVRRHVNQEPFFEHTDDPAAEAAADRFPAPQPEPGRTDLRHLACYTIDPPDAKDFDDAVGLEPLPDGGTRLWVHVADVSHYVTPDSLLDRHARKRATSVYLPGRVLPMLPHRLSDDLCSLRDDGDRYALSVGIEVDAAGRMGATQFHKALIRVTQNLHYGQALERARAGEAPFAQLLDLAQRMRTHRRGIELETGELKVLLGDTGFSALEKRADDATRMIETFMVAANEAVARHLADAGVPLLFRCHPLPEPTKAQRFAHQMETMGMPIAMDLPRPARRADEVRGLTILDQLKAGGGKLNLFGGGISLSSAPSAPASAAPPPPDPVALPGFAALPRDEQDAWLAPFRNATQTLAALADDALAEVGTLKLLACMGRAFYSPDNQGHFGLASTHYCHFTSPIRRYPDLVVHRNLKWLLAGRSSLPDHSQESLRAMCDHCSNQEQAAAQLERRIKSACLVLATLEAEATSGTARITGLTPASVFVLRGDGIEARIPARDLPGGPYDVDEWESMLSKPERDIDTARLDEIRALRQAIDPETGEVRRVRARLGDTVTVRLAGRDVAAGRTGAQLLAW